MLKLVERIITQYSLSLIHHSIFPPPHSSFKRLFMTKLKHFYMEMTCSFTHYSGFKPYYSQVLTHHTSVNNFYGNRNNTALVFLDLQEVFNCLDHPILPE